MSNFIKIRRRSRSRMLRLQRILMIPTELRTSALCVRCAATSKNPIKPNDLLSFVFIFVVLVALSFRIFFPTVLQMVVHFFHFAHAPSWADFTPSPSASNVFSFFFYPPMFTCVMHTHVFWSSGLYIYDNSRTNSSSGLWRPTQNPLQSLAACARCLFTLVPGGPQPDGSVVSEP